MRTELDVARDRLQSQRTDTRQRAAAVQEFNDKVGRYNQLMTDWNAKRGAFRQMVERYNVVVKEYNECMRSR